VNKKEKGLTLAESIDKQPQDRNRRVHMANERTFLAWIRTSIAIMAFGFVVERFSLFVRQMSYFVGKELPLSHGYSAAIGIFLVAVGTVICILAFVRYRNVEQHIDADTYHPSNITSVLLTVSISVVGVILIVYLVHSF
jgi:putative membrane protein